MDNMCAKNIIFFFLIDYYEEIHAEIMAKTWGIISNVRKNVNYRISVTTSILQLKENIASSPAV